MADRKTDDKIKLIMLIVEMAIKYGWPLVTSLIGALKKEDITLADIKALAINDDEPFIP